MKVLFFCNLVPEKFGAYEGFLVALTQALTAAGDTLEIVFGGVPAPAMADRLRTEGLSWRVLEGWTDGAGREHAWAFPRGALRLLRATRPDLAVVNYGNELPALTAALLAPLAGGRGVRWIWQQHQQVRDPAGAARYLSRLRLLALRFGGFIAVYDGGAASLRRRGVPADRIAVVYNGIRDVEPRRPAGWLRRELGVASATRVLITTGWLISRKRIDFILHALVRVRARVAPPVALLVVGDGPERARLEALSRELGLAEWVFFLGIRQDVRDLLFEADVLVHASRAETCTYAITEAMAAGRPAVVTEAGAAREQIVAGETGDVVAADDRDGFVEALVRLLEDDHARARQGAAARQRFLARYRVEDAARTYVSVLRRWAQGAAA